MQASYKWDNSAGTVIPFSRWSYFDGARKFSSDAPTLKINELDFGIEYQPWSSFEIALIYTHAFERSASTKAIDTPAGTSGYYMTKGSDRISVQGQFNF